MANTFKLSDIKAGYLLHVKNNKTNREFNMTVIPCKKADDGVIFFAMLVGERGVPEEDGALACINPGEDWWPIRNFNDSLATDNGDEIVAVYGYTEPSHLMDNSTEDRELLWKKEEAAEPAKVEKNAAPVKMTMAQIRAALGYEVELTEE